MTDGCWRLARLPSTRPALVAQRPTLDRQRQAATSAPARPVIALTNVRVIDGTGAPARDQQTLIIRDGTIAELGDASRVTPPPGAEVIDLAGQSVMPGLVMLHEHLYYPTGPGVYGQLGESFSRLYLAGGVTTMRTGGNMNGYMDINLKRAIEAGQKAGPGDRRHGAVRQRPEHVSADDRGARRAEEARRHVAYWADQGATSFKAYMQISRAALGAAIDEAHKRGMKVTGHLCSVTYSEAADLGIDNLEHGFLAATDFVADKQPDVCPGQGRGQQTITALDENSAPFKALVQKLVDKGVALTSTLTVFETFTPGRPMPPGLEVLTPQLKQQFEQTYARVSQNKESNYVKLFPKAMALERAFARAGGMLVAGTDPTGSAASSRLLESAPGRAARRCRLHAARGHHDRHAERRAVSRARQDASAVSPSASRPTWWSSTATRRRTSPTCARSRSSSARASGTTRRS